MALYAVDSVSSEPIIQRAAFGSWSDTTIVTFGFACCLFSGLTRSFGMTMYRQIKNEVDPITVVFIHAVLTCFAALPVMREYPLNHKNPKPPKPFKPQKALTNRNYETVLSSNLLFCLSALISLSDVYRTHKANTCRF